MNNFGGNTGRTVKFVDGIRVSNSRNITENHLRLEMVGLGPGQWRNSLGDGKFEPRTPITGLGVCRLWYR